MNLSEPYERMSVSISFAILVLSEISFVVETVKELLSFKYKKKKAQEKMLQSACSATYIQPI